MILHPRCVTSSGRLMAERSCRNATRPTTLEGAAARLAHGRKGEATRCPQPMASVRCMLGDRRSRRSLHRRTDRRRSRRLKPKKPISTFLATGSALAERSINARVSTNRPSDTRASIARRARCDRARRRSKAAKFASPLVSAVLQRLSSERTALRSSRARCTRPRCCAARQRSARGSTGANCVGAVVVAISPDRPPMLRTTAPPAAPCLA